MHVKHGNKSGVANFIEGCIMWCLTEKVCEVLVDVAIRQLTTTRTILPNSESTEVALGFNLADVKLIRLKAFF